jgi:hypothetical protein
MPVSAADEEAPARTVAGAAAAATADTVPRGLADMAGICAVDDTDQRFAVDDMAVSATDGASERAVAVAAAAAVDVPDPRGLGSDSAGNCAVAETDQRCFGDDSDGTVVVKALVTAVAGAAVAAAAATGHCGVGADQSGASAVNASGGFEAEAASLADVAVVQACLFVILHTGRVFRCLKQTQTMHTRL